MRVTASNPASLGWDYLILGARDKRHENLVRRPRFHSDANPKSQPQIFRKSLVYLWLSRLRVNKNGKDAPCSSLEFRVQNLELNLKRKQLAIFSDDLDDCRRR